MAKRIYVAGHNGMVGSALVRALANTEQVELLTRGSQQLDLCDQAAVQQFFAENQIDEVYLAAAKVGGIHANDQYPAEFIYQNLMIQSNVVQAAHTNKVGKLLLLGSSCIYPKLAQQPMQESALLGGQLEPTNEPYAIAKIAGIKLCESYNRQYGTDYRSLMPTNLYGDNDNFHPDNSHVIPAMLQRFHLAKQGGADSVTVWGTGSAKREFLHVDDLARACVFIMGLSKQAYSQATEPRLSHINVGTGTDCSIAELAYLIKQVVGFEGEIEFDLSKPDGAPRKLLDVERLESLGWQPNIELAQGLSKTYAWYLQNLDAIRGASA